MHGSSSAIYPIHDEDPYIGLKCSKLLLKVNIFTYHLF